MSDNVVYVKNLKQSYDGKHFVVNDVSFHVSKGEIYGLLGKNGAGKTTTIRTLSTIIPPMSGTVEVLGYNVREHSEKIRKRIGLVLQNESFDFTTVEKNLRTYGMLWNVPREVLKSRIDEVISVFGLENYRKTRAFELSGGQKKRLQVAREFLHDMDLLFLDEPTVGLDPIMRRNVLNYIKDKVRNGLTVFYTTQIMEEADYLCDRISIMNNGKIVVEGTSSELKSLYGEYKTVYLVFDQNLETAEGILATYGENVSIDKNEAKIVGKNIEETLPALLSDLKSRGIKVEKISMEETSLDDVFLKVVS
ncbi:MAG: ATP-binding cassette domain-containing protein [Thermoplasmata archaeon]